MTGTGRAWRAPLGRAVAAAWILGAVVTWNVVFDGYIARGASDYVERQRRHTEGRGPLVDMDQVMDAARADGLRNASAWALAELVPGIVVWWWLRRRARTV